MRLRIFFLASIAATGMGTVAVAAPAQAAGQDRHCVIDVSDPARG
jgi:hypothetical protein